MQLRREAFEASGTTLVSTRVLTTTGIDRTEPSHRDVPTATQARSAGLVRRPVACWSTPPGCENRPRTSTCSFR